MDLDWKDPESVGAKIEAPPDEKKLVFGKWSEYYL